MNTFPCRACGSQLPVIPCANTVTCPSCNTDNPMPGSSPAPHGPPIHEGRRSEATPAADAQTAWHAVQSGDIPRAAFHIASALSSDPSNREWVGILEEVIRRADDPLRLAPLDDEETTFGIAAMRAYMLARLGRHADALELIADVARSRPDVEYLLWASWWLQAPGVVQSLQPEWLLPRFVSPLMRLVGAAPVPTPPNDARLSNIRHAAWILGLLRQAHPRTAPLWFVSSMTARRLGQREEAISLARTAHQIEPSYSSCAAVANALRDVGQVDDAAGMFKQAMQFDPEDVAAWNDIGDMMLEAKRLPEALDAYNRVLAHDPKHGWAYPSAMYVRFRLSNDVAARQALLCCRSDGPDDEGRARALAEEIEPAVPYVNVLPSPGDATAKAIDNVLQQVAERPRNEGGTVALKVTHPEAPSVLLAWQTALSMMGERSLELKLTVERVQQPDPRLAKGNVDFTLWAYDGTTPRVNVAPPDPRAAAAIGSIAQESYLMELWEPRARQMGAQWGPPWVPSFVATMVHPPLPLNPSWCAIEWVRRVQVAAALVISHVDQGWEGSTRKRTLTTLALGPTDWTVDAAVIALARLARVEPVIRTDVLRLFGWLEQQAPRAGFTCYVHPLVHSWLTLGPDEATRKRLMEFLEREEEDDAPKPLDIPRAAEQISAAQQQLASGDGGDPDPVVFPGQRVARLSDYVQLMRRMQMGDMMGALAHFGLDMMAYSAVATAWGQRLGADPMLNAKFARMMQN